MRTWGACLPLPRTLYPTPPRHSFARHNSAIPLLIIRIYSDLSRSTVASRSALTAVVMNTMHRMVYLHLDLFRLARWELGLGSRIRVFEITALALRAGQILLSPLWPPPFVDDPLP